MRDSGRGRISVELKQLRPLLWSHAKAAGVRPSGFVRDVLAAALSGPVAAVVDPEAPLPKPTGRSDSMRVRVTLRIGANQAAALRAASRVAGVPPGELVEGLLDRVPVLQGSDDCRESISALTVSSAEIASLSRSLRHLAALLQIGSVQAALEYRETLLSLDRVVQSHLRLASRALASLKPRPQSTSGGAQRRDNRRSSQ